MLCHFTERDCSYSWQHCGAEGKGKGGQLRPSILSTVLPDALPTVFIREFAGKHDEDYFIVPSVKTNGLLDFASPLLLSAVKFLTN